MENLMIVLVGLIALMIMLCFVLFFSVLLIIKGPKEQPKQPAPPRELSPEEELKAKRLKKEVANMLSYTGEPQEEIIF